MSACLDGTVTQLLALYLAFVDILHVVQKVIFVFGLFEFIRASFKQTRQKSNCLPRSLFIGFSILLFSCQLRDLMSEGVKTN